MNMSQSSFSNSPLSISGQENLLTPSEVAALFRVDPKTVTRWAKAGKLTSIRTLGGHRRYKESEVKALLKVILPNTSLNQVGGNK
jgi:excisionase family DNA binding protein